MDERRVQPQSALSAALVLANPVQCAMPIGRLARRAGDVGSLIVAVMDGVDVIAVGRAADRAVVGRRTEAAMDGDTSVALPERLQVGTAERLQAVVVPGGDLGAVTAVELLNDEMRAQSMPGHSSLRFLGIVEALLRVHRARCDERHEDRTKVFHPSVRVQDIEYANRQKAGKERGNTGP